jgi:hypothetical protein
VAQAAAAAQVQQVHILQELVDLELLDKEILEVPALLAQVQRAAVEALALMAGTARLLLVALVALEALLQ